MKPVLVGGQLVFQGHGGRRVGLRLRSKLPRCRAAVWHLWQFHQCLKHGRHTHAGLAFCTSHARIARMDGGKQR